MKKNVIADILLACVIAACCTPRAAGAQTGGEIRRKLDRVLRQERYIYTYAEDRGEEGAEKNGLIARIEDYLRRIWNYLYGALRRSPVFPFLVYAVCASLILLAAVIISRRFDPSRRGDTPGIGPGVEEWQNLDFGRELALADSLLHGGKHRESVMTAMNALWLYFNHTGAIRYARGATNRECLSRLAGHARYGEIRAVMLDSEHAVYAEEAVSEFACRNIFSAVRGIVQG